MPNRIVKPAVAAALLGVASLVVAQTGRAQELRKEGRFFVAEVRKTFEVSPGGTLRISGIRGDVRVDAWAKNQVHIHEIKKMDVLTEAEARAVLERSRMSYAQEGNVVTVAGENFRRESLISDFRIQVPKSFNLDVTTRGGDLNVRGVGGEIRLNTAGGDMTLSRVGGPIDVSTSGGDVSISDSKRSVNVRTAGGDIDLRNVGGRISARTSGGDVTLKGSADRVELETAGGDIVVYEAGGAVIAQTAGGDIEIKGARGGVAVRTSGGDIEAQDIAGPLEARTAGGDIEGHGIGGSVSARTAGGGIELRGVQGGVVGKTAGGDVEVEITLEDFTKPHAVELQTAGGEIALYIPEKLPATIVAEIKIRERWSDYNIYSDFPLTISRDEENGTTILRARGDINGGGDAIDLRTVNGSIYIKKTTP